MDPDVLGDPVVFSGEGMGWVLGVKRTVSRLEEAVSAQQMQISAHVPSQ